MNKEEQVYQEFWKDIIENKDGTINIEQLKKELYDFYFIINEVPKVYKTITNGLMSKPNYYATEVISQFEDYINKEFILKNDLKDIVDSYDSKDTKWNIIEKLVRSKLMEINCGNWDEPRQECKIDIYCMLGNKLCCLECKDVNNCKSSCKTEGGSYNPIKKVY